MPAIKGFKKALEFPSEEPMKALKLTPAEEHLYEHHLNNLKNHKAVVNSDGSVSTIFNTAMDIQGRTYIFPTVWDGQILDPRTAADKAIREKGLNYWPSYKNDNEAEARYSQMHSLMDADVEGYRP